MSNTWFLKLNTGLMSSGILVTLSESLEVFHAVIIRYVCFQIIWNTFPCLAQGNNSNGTYRNQSLVESMGKCFYRMYHCSNSDNYLNNWKSHKSLRTSSIGSYQIVVSDEKLFTSIVEVWHLKFVTNTCINKLINSSIR